MQPKRNIEHNWGPARSDDENFKIVGETWIFSLDNFSLGWKWPGRAENCHAKKPGMQNRRV